MGIDYDIKVQGIDKLTEGNWEKRGQDITFAFMEAGLVGYLDGSIMAPSINADLKGKNEWLQYNSCITSTLGCMVNDSLAQELTSMMLVADAWAILKKRTIQSGIISKLNSM